MDIVFHIELQEEFQKAIEELMSSYCNSNTVIQTTDSSVTKPAKEDLKKLLQDSNFDENKVHETLVQKGWDEQRITYFVKLLNDKKPELLYASLNKHNSEYGETITNFDWFFKLVLGTSELNTLNYPLLQLVLSTENNDIPKKILYDINKNTLLKFIDTLEKLDDL